MQDVGATLVASESHWEVADQLARNVIEALSNRQHGRPPFGSTMVCFVVEPALLWPVVKDVARIVIAETSQWAAGQDTTCGATHFETASPHPAASLLMAARGFAASVPDEVVASAWHGASGRFIYNDLDEDRLEGRVVVHSAEVCCIPLIRDTAAATAEAALASLNTFTGNLLEKLTGFANDGGVIVLTLQIAIGSPNMWTSSIDIHFTVSTAPSTATTSHVMKPIEPLSDAVRRWNGNAMIIPDERRTSGLISSSPFATSATTTSASRDVHHTSSLQHNDTCFWDPLLQQVAVGDDANGLPLILAVASERSLIPLQNFCENIETLARSWHPRCQITATEIDALCRSGDVSATQAARVRCVPPRRRLRDLSVEASSLDVEIGLLHKLLGEVGVHGNRQRDISHTATIAPDAGVSPPPKPPSGATKNDAWSGIPLSPSAAGKGPSRELSVVDRKILTLHSNASRQEISMPNESTHICSAPPSRRDSEMQTEEQIPPAPSSQLSSTVVHQPPSSLACTAAPSEGSPEQSKFTSRSIFDRLVHEHTRCSGAKVNHHASVSPMRSVSIPSRPPFVAGGSTPPSVLQLQVEFQNSQAALLALKGKLASEKEKVVLVTAERDHVITELQALRELQTEQQQQQQKQQSIESRSTSKHFDEAIKGLTAQSESKIASLEAEVSQWRGRYTALFEQHQAEVGVPMKQLESQVATTQKLLEQCAAQRDATTTRLQAALTQCQGMESALKRQEQLRGELELRLKETVQAKDHAEGRLKMQRTAAEDDIAKLSRRVEALEEDKKNLVASLKALGMARRAEHFASSQEGRPPTDHNAEELSRMSQQVASLQRDVGSLADERARLERECQEKDLQLRTMRKTIEMLSVTSAGGGPSHQTEAVALDSYVNLSRSHVAHGGGSATPSRSLLSTTATQRLRSGVTMTSAARAHQSTPSPQRRLVGLAHYVAERATQ